MIRFEVSTEIKRPLGEVFAYADDPTNLAEWNSIVEESKASETPVRKGTKITTRARFLGRRVDSIAEVTEHVPNQKFVQMSDKPFPLTITTRTSSRPPEKARGSPPSWRVSLGASSGSASPSWFASPRSNSRRSLTR
jgi:hypothetical protein